MIDQAFDTNLVPVLITCCLWYWTVKKGNLSVSQLSDDTRQFNRSASLAFFFLIAVEGLCIYTNWPITRWLAGVLSALIYIVFSIESCQLVEGFWTKRRNQMVGGLAFLLLGCGLPVVLHEPVLIPLVFAAITTHVCHANAGRLYTENIRDLETIQAKVLKLEAELRLYKIRDQFLLTPVSPSDHKPLKIQTFNPDKEEKALFG